MEPSTSQNINHPRNSYPLKIRTIKSRFFKPSRLSDWFLFASSIRLCNVDSRAHKTLNYSSFFRQTLWDGPTRISAPGNNLRRTRFLDGDFAITRNQKTQPWTAQRPTPRQRSPSKVDGFFFSLISIINRKLRRLICLATAFFNILCLG